MKKIFIYFTLLLAVWQVQAINVEVTVSGDATHWDGALGRSVGDNGTFRWAIESVNTAGAGPHAITFNASLNNTTINLVHWEEVTLRVPDVTIDGTGQNITIQNPGASGSALALLDIADAANSTIAQGGPVLGAHRTIIKGLNWKNVSQFIGALAIASDYNEIVDCSFTSGGGLYIGYIQYAWVVPATINKANNNKVYYTGTNGTLEGSLYVIGDKNDVTKININGDLIIGAINGTGTVIASSDENNIHDFTVRDKTRLIGVKNVLDKMTSGDSGTAKGQGVFVEGNDNEIKNSTIHVGENLNGGAQSPPAGIVVQPSSDNVKIDNIILTNTLPVSNAINIDGIRLTTATGAVITNVEASDFWNGIMVRDDATGASIADSKFHDNKNHGLFVYNGSHNASITNIDSYANAFSGTTIWSSENTSITNSRAYNNTFNGFSYVNTTTANTLDGNYAYGNTGGDGILLENGKGSNH